jgi:hypothetical protein
LVNDLRGGGRSPQAVQEPLREQWVRILRHSNSTLKSLPAAGSPRILFTLAHGWGEARMCIESILAMALRMRGAEVWTLACDKSLPACEFNELGNYAPMPPAGFGPPLSRMGQLERCRICTENIADPFVLLPIQQAAFSQFLRPDDQERVERLADTLPYEAYGQFIYRGIRVGEHAHASMMRATLRGTLLDDPYTRWLYRRFLTATVLTADLTERALEHIRPDRVVAVHGVYATHGTICEVARKLGIPVIVHGVPYRKGTIWLSHRDTYHRTLVTEPTSHWESLELTPQMAARVDEYLAAKRLGGKDYVAYHANAIDDREAIRAELKLDPQKPIVSLYTNVLWDAQLFYEYNVFSNMLEWLYETIRYFARRPDLQLVIRLHPAEARGTMPTKQPLKDELAREFPILPDNVRVAPPESHISSYTLAEMSKAALIYGARMGVEIAVLGTPLIIAGETFNRRKGYSYDAETRDEYFAFLDRIPSIPANSPEMVRRARLYAYHFLYRLMIDFPLFSVTHDVHLSNPRLEFDYLEELEPGKCAGLDVVCRGILDGKTAFIQDSPAPSTHHRA